MPVDKDLARKIAEALEEAGIVSDVPESGPNPFHAAQQAFYICQGITEPDAWRELKERLTGPSIPQAVYHRKLGELCHRALRRPDMPGDLREAVAYGWGYFAAMLEAVKDAAHREKSNA